MTSASRLWTVKRSELKLKQQSWQGSCFQAWRQCSFMGSLIGNLTYPCGGQFFFSGVGAKVKKTYPGIPESNILKQYTLKQQFVKDFLSRGGLGMLQGSRGYAVVLVSWNLDSTVCYAVIWRVTHERRCGMMSGRVVLDSQRSSEAQSQSHHDSWPFAFFWWGVCHIETKLLDLGCLKNGLTIPYGPYISHFLREFSPLILSRVFFCWILKNFTHIPIGHIPTLGSTSRFVKNP